MTSWKKGLLIAGAVLVLIVGTLAAAPLLFRDQIETRVKAAINDAVDARVEFGDVGLSLLRSFPNLSLSLRDLSVTGVGAFEGDTLAHVGDLRVVVNLGSAIGAWRRGDPLEVRSILVDRPYLHARVLEDGRASWDILRAANEAAEAVAGPDAELADPAAAETEGGGRGVAVALRRVELRDGRVALEDAASGLLARLDGFALVLAGDFTAERFALRTTGGADSVTVVHAGIPYLSGARLGVDADVDADMAARRFTFGENRVTLNELGLAFNGAMSLLEEGVDLDLTFAADRAQLRDILSLVPALYREGFDELEADGTVAVGGLVRGVARGHAVGAVPGAAEGGVSVPAFAVNVDVADGTFRYPDLPLPARGIALRLSASNPGGDLDGTVVDVSRFRIVFGDDPFEATMALRTPVSDPAVALTANGRLDLAAVAGALPLEGIDTLRGTVTTDAAVRARRSDVEAERYDRVEARGEVSIQGLALRGERLRHPVDVDGMTLALSPRQAELTELRARLGSSDLAGTGSLDNLLGFALWGEDLRGRATVSSRSLDLDEWRSEDRAGLRAIPVPPRLDLTLGATADRITFGDLTLTDARGTVRVADRRLTLEDFALRTLGGDVVTSGWYDTTDPARPAFDLDLGVSAVEIPAAFSTLNTVRALAPAAQYATGRFSAELGLTGTLAGDMKPVLEALEGIGTIRTAGVSLQGMPLLQRLAEAVRFDRLRSPSLSDFTTAIEIRGGRLHVNPFDVRLGETRMNVAGSNGIDRSLDYRLQLELPAGQLGEEARQAVRGLLAEAGRAGFDFAGAETVRLGAVVGGTMGDPTIRVQLRDAAASATAGARQQAEARLQEEAGDRVDSARVAAERRAAAARDSARARAQAEADRIVREAEARAASIREDAAQLAATVRTEANERADRLVADATNPVAKRAAEVAADRIRREGEARARQIEGEADQRATQVVTEARERANALVAGT